MRKYFLLSAAALLAATSANATTDYAEVTAKATIEVAGTFECDDMDWGTIVVKQGNSDIEIDGEIPIQEFVSSYDDLISVSGKSYTCCTASDGNTLWDEEIDINDFVLTNSSGDTMSASAYGAVGDQCGSGRGIISSTLRIPAEVKAGEYTGSFTVTYTY
ncbi:MAG: hypothetical protein E7016_00775 [Alphaproteobacteria bacterium]|nr:hypothetical protein [Alphaproteobacteria bacterium]